MCVDVVCVGWVWDRRVLYLKCVYQMFVYTNNPIHICVCSIWCVCGVFMCGVCLCVVFV